MAATTDPTARFTVGRILALTTVAWLVLVATMLGGQQLTRTLGLGPAAGQVLRGIVPALAAIAATVGCRMYLSALPAGAALRDVGFRAPHPRQWHVALAACLPILAAHAIIFLVLGVPATLVPLWPLVAVKFAIAQAIAEEVLFRGFVFDALRRGRSFQRATLLAGLLFAVVHLTNLLKGVSAEIVVGAAISTVYAFVLAIPLARLYERGGRSIAGVALLHFVIDSNNFFAAPSESVPALLVYVLVGAFGSVAVAWHLAGRWLPDAGGGPPASPARVTSSG